MNAATDLAHLTDPIVAIATAPGRGAPTTTSSSALLPRYWPANSFSRSSEMPTARIGSACSTIATPAMRPAVSMPTRLLIGLPE